MPIAHGEGSYLKTHTQKAFRSRLRRAGAISRKNVNHISTIEGFFENFLVIIHHEVEKRALEKFL